MCAAAVLRVEVDGDRLAVGQAPGVLGAGAQFAGQHVVLGEGGHHMSAPALVLVVGGEQGVPVDDRLGELPECPHAVVAAGHGLQQGALERRRRLAHAPAQQRRQRARAGHERGDPLVAIGALRILGQGGDVLLHGGVGLVAGGQDERLVEVAEAGLAREVGDHLVPALGRRGQADQRVAEVFADVARELVGLLKPAVEDGQHGGAGGPGALLGEVEAVAGGLELGRAVEARDAVVGERPAEPLHEPFGQSLGLGVERPQVGVQVFLRAAQQRLGRVFLLAPGLGQDAQVGVDLEQAMLAGDQRRVAGKRVGACAVEVLDDGGDLIRMDVVPEHEALEAQQVLVAASGNLGPRATRQPAEVEATHRLRRRGIVFE